jgi:hypothetical protein
MIINYVPATWLCKKRREPVQFRRCEAGPGNSYPAMDNGKLRIGLAINSSGDSRMIRMPDGIVTVHLDGERYRGAYYFHGDELVVTAYGLRESSADMSVLQGERGKAALNLAKLVLIDMVRETMDEPGLHPGLSLQGSTTQICLDGSITHIGF